MNTDHPSEYISLIREENFSEIYGYRLLNPDTCPQNGARDDSCSCHNDHPDAGKTRFHKVRFNVESMKVIGMYIIYIFILI